MLPCAQGVFWSGEQLFLYAQPTSYDVAHTSWNLNIAKHLILQQKKYLTLQWYSVNSLQVVEIEWVLLQNLDVTVLSHNLSNFLLLMHIGDKLLRTVLLWIQYLFLSIEIQTVPRNQLREFYNSGLWLGLVSLGKKQYKSDKKENQILAFSQEWFLRMGSLEQVRLYMPMS